MGAGGFRSTPLVTSITKSFFFCYFAPKERKFWQDRLAGVSFDLLSSLSEEIKREREKEAAAGEGVLMLQDACI